MMNLNEMELKALEYAEKYGIIEYEVIGNTMVYETKGFDGANWNTYTHEVELNK